MRSTWPALLGMLLLALPAAAQVQLIYTIPDGAVTITGYSGFGPLETLIIPATLDSLPVTAIGDYAFYELDSVTNVTIPASVTNIGDGAFSGCASLTAIFVDTQNSFYGSTNGVLFDKNQNALVEYPGGLAGDYTIPGSVVSIGFGAFELCYDLTNVTIPGSVASIGDDAFSDCTSMTNIIIPASVTNIGAGPFSGCASLVSITVDAANPVYSSTNGVLFDKNQTALIEWPGGRTGSYSIPGSVTSVESNAFSECISLTNVTVPASVTNIGDGAFFGCTRLAAISVNATNPFYTSASGVLFNKNKTTLVDYPGGLTGNYTVPGGVINIGEAAFESCENLTSVSIPGSVTNIEAGAFENCFGLAKATMAAGVAGIGSNAFANCDSLASITIPGTIGKVGVAAFENCSFLASATMNTGVASIESNAFENCYSLASVTIPASITNIGEEAFDYCLSLASVTIPANVRDIGAEAFAFCSGLATVTIPHGVTNLGEEAFGYCSGLTNVTLSDGITAIEPYTFYECSGLAAIAIPGSVTNIEAGAFEQCYSLASVSISTSVASIGDEAFGDCTSLTQITIPSGVTNIAAAAFNDCASLTAITVDAQNPVYSSVDGVLFNRNQTTLVEVPGGFTGSYTIPDSVTQICPDAFENCQGLTNVSISESVTTIGAGAFENCAGLTSIAIPGGVTSIGDGAFGGTQITNFYFAGNAPSVLLPAFDTDNNPVIYYLSGTAGWGAFSANTGLSPVLWNPAIQTGAGFSVRDNAFAFTITGPTNLVLVVKACANLAEPVWTPLQTVTLTNGSFHFTEPFQSNIAARFYGLGFP